VDNEDRSALLASKVDALVAKRNIGVDERNIPVLTDVVDAPQWQPGSGDGPVAQLDKGSVAQLDKGALAQLDKGALAQLGGGAEADPLKSLSDEDIDRLSQEIFARVSQRIDAELATSLEAQLSEHLQSQINSAVTHVLADMKLGIANEIGDAINAALADRLRKK